MSIGWLLADQTLLVCKSMLGQTWALLVTSFDDLPKKLIKSSSEVEPFWRIAKSQANTDACKINKSIKTVAGRKTRVLRW